MKHRSTLLILTAVTLLVLAPASDVFAQRQAQGTGDTGNPGRASADRVAAAAHLEGVGSVEGWGRASVTDTVRDDEVRRAAAVHFFGLEPDAEYSVEIDGFPLGTITSDGLGDGWLRFGGTGGDFPAVPEDLPPAGDLFLVQVLDESLALVLEGQFVLREYGGMQWNGLIYHERISLILVETGDTGGIARVARDADDVQAFETKGCHLTPDEAYEIFVDGFLAGMATADAIGHAGLELSTGDEDNPLPEDLQPIEDLRLVEWINAAGDVVLTGSFTGENMVNAGSQGENGHHGEDNENGGNGGQNNNNGGENGGQGGNGDGGNGGEGEGDGTCPNP